MFKFQFQPRRSPRLPWEVIERIIEFCSGNSSALKSFALTCKQLQPRSILVLYTNVIIKPPSLDQFYKAINDQPHLKSIVNSLSFPWDCLYTLDDLLPDLPNLRHITFNKDSTYDAITLVRKNSWTTAIRTVTIGEAIFDSQTDLVNFLSAFPNMETLTCKNISVNPDEMWLKQANISRPVRLRTLNMLQGVDKLAASSLLLWITASEDLGHTQSPSALSPALVQEGQMSLTWWIQATTDAVLYVISALQDLQQRIIQDVTLVLWNHDIGCLWSECRQPAKLGLYAKLEEALLKFCNHHVKYTVPIRNVRKTISWSQEFSRSVFNDNWALAEDIGSSGKFGHDSDVNSLVVSSDGRWVATASSDGTIILWDARVACISQEWFAHNCAVKDLAFSPDNQRLASASKDNVVAIWDISGIAYQIAALTGSCCTWSSNGVCIASQDGDVVTIWDARTFQSISLENCKNAMAKPLFSHDAHWLLIHDDDNCRLLDMTSGTYLVLPLQKDNQPNQPSAAAFNHANTRVAVGYTDGLIRVWDIATGHAPLQWRAHDWFEVNDVSFSPDDRRLLSVSVWRSWIPGTRSILVWDANTSALVLSLAGHQDRVRKACFSPCGKYIVSASNDKKVRVQRMSEGQGTHLATLSDHGDWVKHVAFTPDGTMLWSAAHNGTVLGRRFQYIVCKSLK